MRPRREARHCRMRRESARGGRFTTTVSAEAVGSWIRRLSHHRMTPFELWDAQTPARRPHRLVLRFRCEVELDARHGRPITLAAAP